MRDRRTIRSGPHQARASASLQVDRAPLTGGLIGREHDAQARDRVRQVVRQVDVVLDGVEQELLFTQAQAVVVRLVGRVDPLVLARELVLFVAVLVVDLQRVRRRV